MCVLMCVCRCIEVCACERGSESHIKRGRPGMQTFLGVLPVPSGGARWSMDARLMYWYLPPERERESEREKQKEGER